MARYINVLPMVDYEASSFQKVRNLLESKKFKYKTVDGETLFQKGDGVWVAPSYIKLSYSGGTVQVEAWINAMGAEQDLEGFVGCAAKKPLKKVVAEVEAILSRPGEGYVPSEEQPAEPAQEATKPKTPLEEAIEAGEEITKEVFFKKYASQSFQTNIKVAGIMGYIFCGVLALTCLANPWSLIDLAIYLGLTLGIHLGKNKTCAILLTVYTVFSIVVTFVATNMISGWGWLALSICAWIVFRNEEKRYKELVVDKQ